MPINNNNQNNTLPVIVGTKPAAGNDLLIYNGGPGSIFNVFRYDNLTPDALYHQGHPIASTQIELNGCGISSYKVDEIESISSNQTKGIVKKITSFSGSNYPYDYLWDEIYTTPLGIYQEVTGGLSGQEFEIINDNTFVINILDANVIPTQDDFVVFQRYFSNPPLSPNTNQTPTDGINNVPVYLQSETHIYQIVSVTQTGPTEWTIEVDKNLIVTSEQYSIVLLNRKINNLQNELFLNTWQLIEVHREQILGDPYNYVGLLFPTGRKNYLNYRGAEYLGLAHLLNPILNNVKTPFIVLDFDDNLKDRIYNQGNTYKIHLPHIIINNANARLVLTNNNTTMFNGNGIGKYAALEFQNKRYGWVFYDLRIAVIDDAELATAMSYNSNRNYTLPDFTLNILNTAPNTIQPDPNTVITLPFDYFITYRIKTNKYDVIYSITKGFNWDSNNQVTISFDPLSFLLENGKTEGIEADQFDVIIGKNIVNLSDPYNPFISDIQDIVIMPAVDLKSIPGPTGIQNLQHTVSYSLTDYNNEVSISNFYDLSQMYGINTPADLLTSKNNWLIGMVEFQTCASKYRLTAEVPILAGNWNATTNETFKIGNPFMNKKLITEIAFLASINGQAPNDEPFIYGKISPPIEKDNQSDITLTVNIDF